MPIDPYSPPQLKIHQELERTASVSVPRMGACILGTSYLLSRYGLEDTESVSHLLSGQDLPWRYINDEGVATNLPADHVVDLASAQLHAEGLRATLAAYDSSDAKIVLESLASPHILQIVTGKEFTVDFASDPNELTVAGHTFVDGDIVRVVTEGTLPATLNGNSRYEVVNSGAGVLELTTVGGTTPITFADNGTGTLYILPDNKGTAVLSGTGLDTSFRGRNCEIGDEVVVNDGVTTRTRTIVDFLGQNIPAHYGVNGNKDNKEAANAAYNPITDTVADSAVVLLKPVTHTISVTQSSLNLNVRGSGVSVDRKVSEEFTITVTEGGAPGSGTGSATFSISSASGIYAATGVKSTVSGGTDYGIADSELAGASVVIAGGTVSVGQVFRFRVYQGYEQLDTSNITLTGEYSGMADTTYVVEVTLGSVGDSADLAEVRIYDTEGIEQVQEDVVVTDGAVIPLGAYGLGITFTTESTNTVEQAGLRAGDKYYVHAVAEALSASIFDKIVLDGPVVDPSITTSRGTPLDVSFGLRYSGVIAKDAAAGGVAWTADADKLSVSSTLSMYVPSRSVGYQWVAYDDATGTLDTTFRAAIPTDSSVGMGSVDSDADIASKIGPITLDNDLGFGVAEALRGSGGQRIYFLNTGGETAAHYTAACKKLESTNLIWAIGLLSDDPEVKATVRNHVLAMSNPEKKNFRKLYVGQDSPGDYPIYEKQANGTPYIATITDSGGGQNTLLTLTVPADGSDFDSLSITAGDLVRITSSGVEYEIASKVSPTELRLKSGPSLPISPAVPFQVWKADTADSQGSYVIQAGNSLTHRRVSMLWYEDGFRNLSGNTPTLIPAKFAAAEYAGWRSATPPQVGGTRQEITAVTSAPAMYNKYGIDDLNRIAGEGVMIVTQTAESGAVYIRQQLTTDTDNGILYYEDNVTMIVDYLSFRFRDQFEDLIGKVNVTDDTIADLYNKSVTLLDQEKQTDVISVYGPLIVDYTDLRVERDPVMRDRINIRVKLQVPLPMNTLDITFETYVDITAAVAAQSE